MGIKKSNYAINQADKGAVIYDEHDRIDSICIILKGRVLAVNDGSKVMLSSGSFLGISDLFSENGTYLNSYIAYDDVTFYCFPVQTKDSLSDIFAANKDYKGLIALSLVKYINEVDKVYRSLHSKAIDLFYFIKKNYEKYLEICKKLGYPTTQINLIDDITDYESDFEIDQKKVEYYKESAKVPLEVWKGFCSPSDTLVLYITEEISELIELYNNECKRLSTYICDIFDGLMNHSDICLFKCFAALAISIEETGGFNKDLIEIIDQMIDKINEVETLLDEKVGRGIIVDRNKMEEIYYLLLSNDGNRKEQVDTNFQYSQAEVEQVNKELNQSLKQILNYANQDQAKSEEFEQYILDFMNLKDKNSTDDETRFLRKRIMERFYELFQIVFFKAYEDKKIPKVIDLFLRYGFIDERLLNSDQLKDLYFLEPDKEENKGLIKVYDIKEWLTLIYKGKKEPSKSEFDLDYNDMLREKRKKSEITEAEEKELQADVKNKVLYELHNMFRYNHRVVNGQISTFIPFLWSENLYKGIQKLYVSKSQINNVIGELLDIDYSAFHREVLYVNNEKGIAKEYIMKPKYPDVVLLPTVGYNGAMWQEITGKRKNSEGRFLLPIFSEANLKDILIKILGRFRWELCRTIQGSSWNNIKYKSLTSEYADYIQFYRKNRDLSEDVKEKLKLQIQKGKGNLREIFVIDYDTWIRNESNGGIRLNKVARELMATYCPFNKEKRIKLSGQPLFADAMERFGRNTVKKIKDLESRYRAIEKDGGELTEELMETLIFYRDL